MNAPEPQARGGRRAGTLLVVVFALAEATLLIVAVLVVLPFAIIDPTLLEDGPLPPGPLLAVLVVPTVLAALVAVAGTALLGDGPRAARVRRELAARWSWRDVGRGLVIGAGGLVLTIPASAAWATWVGDEQANSAVGEAFAGRQLGPAAAMAAFLAIWLVAPVCEEVIFRGALWRALEHWRWNRWVIFIVTSLVFSVAHMELLRTPLLLVLSVPIGLARLLTGNLLGSVVAHQVNNFLPALGLLLALSG
ncbi:MAG: lysostaphin resistance A-like protein [Pseudonocardiaceae bacterium]